MQQMASDSIENRALQQAVKPIFSTLNSVSVHTTHVCQIPDTDTCFDLALTDAPALFFNAMHRVCRNSRRRP